MLIAPNQRISVCVKHHRHPSAVSRPMIKIHYSGVTIYINIVIPFMYSNLEPLAVFCIANRRRGGCTSRKSDTGDDAHQERYKFSKMQNRISFLLFIFVIPSITAKTWFQFNTKHRAFRIGTHVILTPQAGLACVYLYHFLSPRLTISLNSASVYNLAPHSEQYG